MEYSIQELSRMAGISTRTLRWYHEIGLLKPSGISDSGCRIYGSKEVDRLQDILFYRALGVKLSQIKEYLDSPSFDRLKSLQEHLEALKLQRENLNRLIQLVQDTIESEKGGNPMNDSQKFEALKQNIVNENERDFGQEIREKYGTEKSERFSASVKNMNQEQYKKWAELDKKILTELEQAVQEKISVRSKEAKGIFDLHKEWITMVSGQYSREMHRGLAELYVEDERFTGYYDKNISGGAGLLREIILYWAD